MFTELLASGSGGEGLQFTLVETLYTTSGWTFYFTVIDSAEGKYHYFKMSSGSTDEHVFTGLKIKGNGSSSFTFTAIDGYRLYEFAPSSNYKTLTDHGVNGTQTVSPYYSYYQSFIAIKGEIQEAA